MLSRMRKRMKGEKGFTLIELLVVIIIIAILAAIAIPTFLGQRQKAQDAAAKSLVRNAMTAIESSYVDARTYAVDAAVVEAIEPSIDFTLAAAAVVDAGTPDVSASAYDPDAPNVVDFNGGETHFPVAAESASGNEFGVYTDKGEGGATTFVRVIGDEAKVGW